MSYDESVAEDARLIILKELAVQVDARSNEVILTRVLDNFAIKRSRDWVRTQLRKLVELGTIRLSEAGTVLIASLTPLGRNHVERREIVDGITRPSDEA